MKAKKTNAKSKIGAKKVKHKQLKGVRGGFIDGIDNISVSEQQATRTEIVD